MKGGLVDEYRQILIDDVPVLDVRSASEFSTGAVPSATNIPILNDEEREKVGIAYKYEGADAAYALGMDLVSGSRKIERIEAWVSFVKSKNDAVICCWRGGQRSEIAQDWLEMKGFSLPRIAGGSKALRQFCLDQLERVDKRSFVVVGGKTGAGKTLLLQRFNCVVDLEQLANHRGSAFGGIGTDQPPPVSFEASLVASLLKTEHYPVTLLEDEGRTIGRIGLPRKLFAQMQAAPLVVLQKSFEERVELTYQNYVSSQNGDALLNSLEKIQRRLGGKRFQELQKDMSSAIETGDRTKHFKWIEKLLVYYYDPQYDYQLGRKQHRVVYEGGATQVAEYLLENFGIEATVR